jgi:stage II sporulation protein D
VERRRPQARWARRLAVAGVATLAAIVTASSAAATFVFQGRGLGHGIGMSQTGADGYARHGWTHEQILAHYYPKVGIARLSRPVRIRVLLGHGSAIGAGSTIRVTDARGRSAILAWGRHRIATVVARYDARLPVRFHATAGLLTLDGAAYRGDLLVEPVGIVDEVPLEAYVQGVVCREMPCRWPAEALAAQAVAARSYAVASLAPHRAFDVYNDTRSQMYGGVRGEDPRGDAAAARTRAQVLVWKGRAAWTFYSASSGGRTASIHDVWSGSKQLPYLVSVRDPYDRGTNGPTRTIAGAELGARFGVGAVTSVGVRRNGSGRPLSVELMGAWGTKTVDAKAIASAFRLSGAWFTVRRLGPPSKPVAAAVAKAAPVVQRPSPARRPSSGRAHPGDVSFLALLLLLFGLLALRMPGRMRNAGLALTTAAAAALIGQTPLPLAHTVAGGTPAASALPSAATPAPPSAAVTPPPPPPPEAPSPPPSTPVAEPPLVPSAPPVAPAVPAEVSGLQRVIKSVVPPPPSLAVPPLISVEPQPPVPGVDGPGPVPVPQPLPPPPQIAGLQLVSLGPTTATVSWRSSALTTGTAASGLGAPVLWELPDLPAYDHLSTLTGLEPGMAQRLWVQGRDDFGQAATAELDVTTPALPANPVATTAGDTIELDGVPFFPRMAWAACSSELESPLEAGINLFLANRCGDDRALVLTLNGAAFAALDPSQASTAPGAIGVYYQDEWDARLPGDVSASSLRASAPPPAPRGQLSFLTLTSHFFSGAAPLPHGGEMYPVLMAMPDVLGFDLYPMESWCRNDAFAAVFDAQRELDAYGKPTYQWIEAGAFDDCPEPGPSAQTIRAEAWLAVAGGADGIGYFPVGWSGDVQRTIAWTNAELGELAPALLADDVQASSTNGDLRVGARTLAGATYAIVVNATQHPVEAPISIAGIDAATADVYGESRQVTLHHGTFFDDFEPLAVHVYVIPPSGWAPVVATTAPAVDVPEVPATGGDSTQPQPF